MADANMKGKLQAKLAEKAQADPEFKAKLLQDPKAAIRDALDVTVPEGIEIEVREETPQKLYLVLPVSSEDMELSDEMLDQAAGGACWDCTDCGSGC